MRIASLLLISIFFSGCVEVGTALRIADFGVKVGFDIHDYAEKKRQEAKELASGDR